MIGLLFAASLLVAACGGSGGSTSTSGGANDASSEQAAVSSSSLTGEFETLAGTTVDLASLEGQDTVLWFWAPW